MGANIQRLDWFSTIFELFKDFNHDQAVNEGRNLQSLQQGLMISFDSGSN
jgi:hypothetical protein